MPYVRVNEEQVGDDYSVSKNKFPAEHCCAAGNLFVLKERVNEKRLHHFFGIRLYPTNSDLDMDGPGIMLWRKWDCWDFSGSEVRRQTIERMHAALFYLG